VIEMIDVEIISHVIGLITFFLILFTIIALVNENVQLATWFAVSAIHVFVIYLFMPKSQGG